MPAYATTAQLSSFAGAQRITMYFDDDSDAGFDALLDGASGELDAALAHRYTVPIDTTSLVATEASRVNALLARWTCTIALWQHMQLSVDDVPKSVVAGYQELRERLKRIGLGKDRLPYLAGIDRPAVRVQGSSSEGAIKSEVTHSLFNTARAYP